MFNSHTDYDVLCDLILGVQVEGHVNTEAAQRKALLSQMGQDLQLAVWTFNSLPLFPDCDIADTVIAQRVHLSGRHQM
jgi:hypothetical protein